MEITDGDLREFRERAKTELKSGCDCGRMRWDDVVEALCREVARLRNESSAANANSAAMREALENLVHNIELRASAFDIFSVTDRKTFLDAKAALAKPPRNCDVGTAEEQYKRFKKFCFDNMGDGMNEPRCSKCPLGKSKSSCHFDWAQMPYEEGKEKTE